MRLGGHERAGVWTPRRTTPLRIVYWRKMIARANTARFEITPAWPVDQGSGFQAARVLAEPRPAEPLEANLLAFWAKEDTAPILLVTLDVLYPGKEVREAIEKAATPLPPERIVVAASHTHRAPMTDSSKPLLGSPDPAYLSWLTAELSHRVEEVLNPDTAQGVSLNLGSGQASHSISRRRKAAWSVKERRLRRKLTILAPDPNGVVDETVIVASFNNSKGEAIAWIWNYACHPVAHPEPSAYSSHYVHHVRHALRSAPNQSNVPVLFFQGFSGDTRPSASVGVTGWQQWVHRLISGPRFRDMRSHDYTKWATSLAECVLAIPLVPAILEGKEPRARRAVSPGPYFANGYERDITFQSVKISGQFVLVGTSGEVVSEYASFVRSQTTSPYTMCLGCLDDVFGYIPTQEMIEAGGYESREFCQYFGFDSVTSDIEDRTKASFAEVLTQS